MFAKKLLPCLTIIVLTTACSSKKSGHDQTGTPTKKVEQAAAPTTSEPPSDNTSDSLPIKDDAQESSSAPAYAEDTVPRQEFDSGQSEPTTSIADQTVHGAIDSSGGNLTSSTEDQVRLFLQDPFLKNFLITTVKRMEIISLQAERYALIVPMLQGNAFLNKKAIDYVYSVDFNYFLESNCIDGLTGEGRDASISSSGRFCFDIEKMQRIPFQSLKLEIVALVMHEIAHMYGYSEADAVKVQNLIRSEYMRIFPDQRTIAMVGTNLKNIHSSLQTIKFDLTPTPIFRREHACANLGMAAGMAQPWHTLFENSNRVIIFGDASYVTHQQVYLPRSHELVELATDLEALTYRYCLFDNDQSDEKFIEELEPVQKRLEDVLKVVTEFVKS